MGGAQSRLDSSPVKSRFLGFYDEIRNLADPDQLRPIIYKYFDPKRTQVTNPDKTLAHLFKKNEPSVDGLVRLFMLPGVLPWLRLAILENFYTNNSGEATLECIVGLSAVSCLPTAESPLGLTLDEINAEPRGAGPSVPICMRWKQVIALNTGKTISLSLQEVADVHRSKKIATALFDTCTQLSNELEAKLPKLLRAEDTRVTRRILASLADSFGSVERGDIKNAEADLLRFFSAEYKGIKLNEHPVRSTTFHTLVAEAESIYSRDKGAERKYALLIDVDSIQLDPTQTEHKVDVLCECTLGELVPDSTFHDWNHFSKDGKTYSIKSKFHQRYTLQIVDQYGAVQARGTPDTALRITHGVTWITRTFPSNITLKPSWNFALYQLNYLERAFGRAPFMASYPEIFFAHDYKGIYFSPDYIESFSNKGDEIQRWKDAPGQGYKIEIVKISPRTDADDREIGPDPLTATEFVPKFDVHIRLLKTGKTHAKYHVRVHFDPATWLVKFMVWDNTFGRSMSLNKEHQNRLKVLLDDGSRAKANFNQQVTNAFHKILIAPNI